MSLTYGPLSSFWWFDRYSVIISNEKLLSELKKFSGNLLAISPFSIGSYLNGHAKYCSTAEYGSFKNVRRGEEPLDEQLLEENQNSLILKTRDSESDEKYSSKCLNQAGIQYKTAQLRTRNLKKVLGRPLVVVFNKEIWIDAHPIPKYVRLF